MKEQKTAFQLLKRYEAFPFSEFEKHCLALLAVFFMCMMFLFFISPSL